MSGLGTKHSGNGWPKVAVAADADQTPLRVRLLWMVAIWVASVSVLLLIAYVLRWVLQQAH